MTKTIIVYGKPVGKGRPKFSSRGGFVRAYTPKTTADYEAKVAKAYTDKYGASEPCEKPIVVSIQAVFPIPSSFRKAEKEKARKGLIKPTKKPDIDNIIKIILDGLNGVAFKDDSQVIVVHATKEYYNNSLEDAEGFVVVDIDERESEE